MTTMTRSYQTRPIAPDVVIALRHRDDAGRATQVIASPDGGEPLRCCLRPSQPGESIALVSYAPLRRWARETQADPGAYEELGPVFIHADQCVGPDGAGFPANQFSARRVLRSYDAQGVILGGRLVETDEAPEEVVEELFADPRVALVHARALEFGCFLFEARRVKVDRQP